MTQENLLEQYHYFASPVFISKQPQFLDSVKAVALDSIKRVHGSKKPDKIYPLRMSGSMLGDERIAPFAEAVAQMAWTILVEQGYAMDNLSTMFTEMWCQEHYQTSSMEYHAHPGGNHLVGFYFPRHAGRMPQGRHP